MVSGQLHASAALIPGERSLRTCWIGGWVGPRAGLDTGAKKKSIIAPAGNWTPRVQPVA
jgi:hypothetical protein